MLTKIFPACLALCLWMTPVNAQDFSFTFNWQGLALCTSGNPNIVPNPRFEMKNVPEGTHFIRFKLKDKNVPSYNHGGGTVPFTGHTVITPGQFKYKSPCPPDGQHLYEWTATALKKKSGGKLGVAKSALKYP